MTKYKHDFRNDSLKKMKEWEPGDFCRRGDKDKNGRLTSCFDYFIIEKVNRYGRSEYLMLHSNYSGGTYYSVFSTEGNNNSPIIKYDRYNDGLQFRLKYYNQKKEKEEIEYNKKYK